MQLFAPLLALLILVGCSEKGIKFEEMSAAKLYERAEGYLKEKNYSKAAPAFDEIERQHPYSDLAMKGQVLSGYCYYMAQKYNEAIDRFRAFQQLHPSSDRVAYALFMVGMCQYEQMPIIERDQEVAVEALATFTQLINAHPHSEYARDAKFKMDLIRDHLAAKQMDIGRFYLAEKSPLAALGRFKTVVDKYETSTHTPEALYRMVECYISLGLMKDARTSAAILGHNFASSSWYKRAYDLLKSCKETPSTDKQRTLEKRAVADTKKDFRDANKIENFERITTTDLNEKGRVALPEDTPVGEASIAQDELLAAS